MAASDAGRWPGRPASRARPRGRVASCRAREAVGGGAGSRSSRVPPGSARAGCSPSCAPRPRRTTFACSPPAAASSSASFPFGVVRQLFEPAARRTPRRASAGSPAPPRRRARSSRPPTPGSDGLASDATFAALHGLYWLTANVAADGPVLLSVDDLHWCDRPSLRFLAYLVRRLEDMPALVGATLRSTDPGTDPALIAEIEPRPGHRAPSARAAQRARRDRDGPRAARRGRPRALLRRLRARDRRQPAAAAPAPHLARGGRREAGRRERRRGRRHRPARRLADRAAAPGAASGRGGERRPRGGRARARAPTCRAVAALAELDEEQVADGHRDARPAEILRPEPPLGFVHPLVRDAVYHELSPAQRELMHARAAAELREAGAPADQVASHLLSMPRRGEEWVVDVLVEAARTAARRSAPDSAVAYLTRALEEPPPPERRGDDPARARHLRHEHLRAARARAPARGLRAARRPAPARQRSLPARAHADLRRRAPSDAATFARRAARRASARARGRAPRARGRGAHVDLLRRDVEGAVERLERRSATATSATGPARRCSPRRPLRVHGRRRAARRAVALALHAMEGGTLLESDNGALLDGRDARARRRRPPRGRPALGADARPGAPERLAVLAALHEPLGRRLQARPG